MSASYRTAVLPRRERDDRYHAPGKLSIVNKETLRDLFTTIQPIFKVARSIGPGDTTPAVPMEPMPREPRSHHQLRKTWIRGRDGTTFARMSHCFAQYYFHVEDEGGHSLQPSRCLRHNSEGGRAARETRISPWISGELTPATQQWGHTGF